METLPSLSLSILRRVISIRSLTPSSYMMEKMTFVVPTCNTTRCTWPWRRHLILIQPLPTQGRFEHVEHLLPRDVAVAVQVVDLEAVGHALVLVACSRKGFAFGRRTVQSQRTFEEDAQAENPLLLVDVAVVILYM